MVVPNEVKVFGSARHRVRLDCPGMQSQILNIQKTHVKALDGPTQPCSTASTTTNNASSCIANFIKREIGCNPQILGSQYSKGTLCNTTEQLSHFKNISSNLFGSDDYDVYAMTGCLSACEKNVYSIIPEATSCADQVKYGEQFLLTLRVNDRSYEERKQYIIYDTDSFIADVGGYMGLLLGCSIWSLYNEIEAFVKKFIIKPLFGYKKMNKRVKK